MSASHSNSITNPESALGAGHVSTRTAEPVTTLFELKKYRIQNLGCADCGAQMEQKISDLEGIAEASLSFATKQLRIRSEHPELHFDAMQSIVRSIESDAYLEEWIEEKPMRRGSFASEVWGEHRSTLLPLGTGIILYLIAIVMSNTAPVASIALLLVSYLILAKDILRKAFTNLLSGSIFDENFLMSVATLAALAIGEHTEAVGVILFYRVGELFEDIAVDQSRKRISESLDLRPETVHLMEGDRIDVIAAQDAPVGARLLIKVGDRIPVDGTVLRGESLLDTSAITGESAPQRIAPGDAVYSGCLNLSAALQLRVDKPLSDSMVSRILDSVENAVSSKPQVERFITRFARIYTPVVVALAAAIAIIPSLVTGEWNHWLYTAITFLVISCPCALVLSIPLTYFSGIGAAGKHNILFKGGQSIEALSDIDTVVLDKTGTITSGTFAVQEVRSLSDYDETDILRFAGAVERYSSHPIAAGILQKTREQDLSLPDVSDLKEHHSRGLSATLDEKELLCGNEELLTEAGIRIVQTAEYPSGSVVYVALNRIHIGTLLIRDELKEDAVSAITKLKQHKLYTVMLTGDQKNIAEAIGKETGIDRVYSKLLPTDKLSIVQELQQEGRRVLFVGDGINDAPVLAGADVGGAMGSGADSAIESADMVYMSSQMHSIPLSLSVSRETSRIAKQNIVLALGIKALVMLLGLLGYANLWFAVFADTGVTVLCVLNAMRLLFRKNYDA